MSALKICRFIFNGTRRKSVQFIQKRFEGNKPYTSNESSIFGNREIVGFGMNGQPYYFDKTDFPCPSIRFKEPTPEIQALRGKERGDWRKLTIDEKKQLYRASFRLTFSEFTAPTGEWKTVVAVSLVLVSCGVWLYIGYLLFVYNKLPDSFNEENKRAQLRRQIDLHMNPINGLGAAWNYKKKDWKRKTWFTPDNPFIDPCTGAYIEEIPYDEIVK